MNKLTGTLSALFCAILVLMACATWVAYCVVDALPTTDHPRALQWISAVELSLAAVFYLLSRGFKKRHYAFLESEDRGLTFDDEAPLEEDDV